jgi:signal transduction histidine kinase
MNYSNAPHTELAELREGHERLAAELALRAREVEMLNAELAETNKGVVALYAELDDRAEQLRQASELKSRFLSYMSHEFRTPLGSIRSISRILLDRLDGPLTPEQEKQVRFVQSAAVELTGMVNDLLDLAKIEAGRITISPAWFEMVDLFSALRGMFKPILTSEAVSLILEEPVDVPRIYTDHQKLSQILRNFISNALKFTHQGEVRVSARREGDSVTFSVADTGIGIAREHHAAIFEDFVQVDSPIQKRLRGTGLGLSLSRKIAHLLGGSVAVESALGKGSTFSVTVPLRFAGPDPGGRGAAMPGAGSPDPARSEAERPDARREHAADPASREPNHA